MSLVSRVGVGVATAVLGGGVVADRRVARTRRLGRAEVERFTPPAADREGYVTASDGVPLSYDESGPLEAPLTVVLVHGLTLDRDTFLQQRAAVLGRFGGRVRVLAYDQRSHGRSGRSAPENTTIEQLGADLDTVLTERAPSGPLVLVGHSMGGMTIMALAERRPELFGPAGRVAGVLLANTSAGRLREVTLGLPAAFSRVNGPRTADMLRRIGEHEIVLDRGRGRATDLAWVTARRISCGRDVDPGLVEHIAAKQARTRVGVLIDFYRAFMAHDKHLALANLRGTPTVVISGGADFVTPPEHSREIMDALPEARLVSVPRAGHLVPLERAETVTGPLLELVESGLAVAEAS